MTRAVTPRAGADAPPRPGTGPWAGLLVAAGVFVGIVVSTVTALSWYRHDMRALESERQSEVAALVDGVRLRLDDIGEFVKGEAASYQGVDLPSQTELNDQFALPEVLGSEPGVIGEFFVEKVDGDDLADFVRRQQAEVSPTFDVLPSGAREEYWVVARAVPSSLSSMIGIDGRSVAVRGASAHVVPGHRPSFCVANGAAVGRSAQRGRRRARTIPRAIVVVTPVYRTRSTPETVDARRQQLRGWAGVVVVGDLFARDLQRPTERTLGLSLFDGGPEDRNTALVGVAPSDLLESVEQQGDVRTATVESLGLQLTVRVTSLAPSPSPSATAPLIVFVGGFLLSLLAGWLAVVLVLSRRRALHLADEAIAELRVSEDEMRKSAARFASLVRRSSDVIAIVDTSGVVEFVTPSIERLLALPLRASKARRCSTTSSSTSNPCCTSCSTS